MTETCKPGDALHHADGSHRTTPPTADGRRLAIHEKNLREHLERLAEEQAVS